MDFEELALYLAPMSRLLRCDCKVVRDGAGTILLPDLSRCAQREAAHVPALTEATARLTAIPLLPQGRIPQGDPHA